MVGFRERISNPRIWFDPGGCVFEGTPWRDGLRAGTGGMTDGTVE